MTDLREVIARALIEKEEKPLYAEMASYLEGYKIGLHWKENYRPGGPFHYSADPHDSKEAHQKAQATQKHYKQWQDGFTAGLARQNKINKK